MIEAVLLPESACRADPAIHLASRVVFPRFALSKHCGFVWKRGQKVDVIWHYNEIGQLVSLAVKFVKTIGHDARKLGLSQGAGSMTGIEFLMPTSREMPKEFGLDVGALLLQLIPPVACARID